MHLLFQIRCETIGRDRGTGTGGDMRLLDLFAGIGGFSLAAHWMGWETVAFVEKDPFCQKVLRKNFGQDIEIYDDITTFSGKPFRGRVDIVTGGFPCQPYSEAGKRKGTADERHLWPEMLRTIVEVQPRYVVGENVRGLVNWSRGLVFEQVQVDLEAAGFEVWAGLLPAAGVGAPHRRDRVWFVAHAVSGGCGTGGGDFAGRYIQGDIGTAPKSQPERNGRKRRPGPAGAVIANTQGAGLTRRERQKRSGRNEFDGLFPTRWEGFSSQSPVCRGDDGIPNRVDRIKSLGNAIVPQIAYEIFKAIQPSPQAQR